MKRQGNFFLINKTISLASPIITFLIIDGSTIMYLYKEKI